MKTRIPHLTILLLLCCQIISAQTPNISEILDQNSDGTFGYYLKQVNGGVLLAENESLPFYPASAIKVLQHLHAMRKVQSREARLNDIIDIPKNSCAEPAVQRRVSKESLSEVLRLMMKESSNNRANVIQDKFGRTSINYTAHNAAMMTEDSQLNHKFACPDNPHSNRSTLMDLGALYETVARGDSLSGTSRDTFYRLMLNKTDDFFIETIIDSEAISLGLSSSLKQRFKSHVRLAYKTGHIPGSVSDRHAYASMAGYVSVPFAGPCQHLAQIRPREFVFGVFAHDTIKRTDYTAAQELFRDQIRRAIQTWKDCPVILEPIRLS